jgi:hypothetical protein
VVIDRPLTLLGVGQDKTFLDGGASLTQDDDGEMTAEFPL